MWDLNVKNKKLSQQCDKVSELEFVAIQFGVKFSVINSLRRYVDKVCQQYLQCFVLFR